MRRHVVRVVSSRIERSRRIAWKLRWGQGAGRYERRRRRDARVNDGPKAVDSIAMAYEKRWDRIKTFIVICIIRGVYHSETNEKIGAACRSGLGIDDHVVVSSNAVPDRDAQLRREIVGGMKLN